jgi:pyridinium-3,5-biscarboxylic acid mononucleotide synthase
MNGSVPGPNAFADLGFARVDTGRQRRQGVPEAVYAPGKTDDEIVAIVRRLLADNDGPVLVTRLAADVAARISDALPPGGGYDPAARLFAWRPAPVRDFDVAVVSAGTADGAVAVEAAVVAQALGLRTRLVRDVGVAGIHRLMAAADQLSAVDAVIVVAGMEGALASVVGGLVGCPVIAVPTSTGYGAALDGVTALLAMLTSCAPGLTVVNIDSGYGAAMAAFRIAHAAGSRS